MDINTLRGFSTLVVMIAFLGIFVWVYLIKNKSDFDEAANQPFADEAENENAHEVEDATEGLR
jgi:cytochrome c oxidase cbb3-type subunit 4